jgi:cytochrome c-type biogenesis protein CcmH
VRAVASRLRCPVCQNESVADSPSALAAQMRELIRARLAQGDPPEAVLDYFVARYGEWILLEPPRRGWGWALWLAPGVLLGGGLLLLARYLRGAVRVDEADKRADEADKW